MIERLVLYQPALCPEPMLINMTAVTVCGCVPDTRLILNKKGLWQSLKRIKSVSQHFQRLKIHAKLQPKKI